MENIPSYIAIVFELTTLLSVWLFFRASRNSNPTLIVLLCWLAVQALVSLTGFYYSNTTFPPRILLLVLPPNLLIIYFFLTASGRKYLDGLDVRTLTLIHIVRVPVEVVLFWLYEQKTIPQLMTFEGRNFDILSGLSAPLVYYFGFVNRKLGRGVLIGWNLVCVGLLLNIVINAIMSLPYPFQVFAHDQPNIAVLYFPFTWLPAVVVPLVLLAHLAVIRKLVRGADVDEDPDIPLIPVG